MIEKRTPAKTRNLKRREIFLPLLGALLGEAPLFSGGLRLVYAMVVLVLCPLPFTNPFRLFRLFIEVVLKDRHPLQLLQGPIEMGIRPRLLPGRAHRRPSLADVRVGHS